ncbi:MAG: sulfatase-like hydrolase/transferase [Proteobacteria bacterium]|nr:sulfatase-like hydrolase/transferase [Pseudomonadota bacterium]
MRLVLVLALAITGCKKPTERTPGPNILVIISDDIGEDKTGAYGPEGETFTPTLDALAAEGMVFRNAYSNPTCSASRGSLQTGRHASRHGIGRWIYPDTETWDLSLDEMTIPEMLTHAEGDYTSAAVGKWHMVRFTRDQPTEHPLDQGFNHHRGSLANPLDAVQSGNTPRSYINWEKNVDGEVEWSEDYMTTDTVNEAIEMLEDMPEPWFLWVALNAAHKPWHVPPDDLNPMGVTESDSAYALYDADTKAADMELARLLDSIDPEVREDLTIIYLADNGTPGDAIEEPYDRGRGKGTVYEGGVRVPMIVTGPHVPEPGTTDALVHFVDVFPTLADIVGVDASALTVESGDSRGQPLQLDGYSLLDVLEDPSQNPRELLFTEEFYPNGPGVHTYHNRTVRSMTHKLIRNEDQTGVYTDRFYDLASSEYHEGSPLDTTTLTTAEAEELARLTAEMDRLKEELTLGW